MDVWRYSDWAGWTDGKQIRDSQPHIGAGAIGSSSRSTPIAATTKWWPTWLAADELHPGDPKRLAGDRLPGAELQDAQPRDLVARHRVAHGPGIPRRHARCAAATTTCTTWSNRTSTTVSGHFEPHNVRLDRIAGQPDTGQDGLARVFDADRLRSRTCSSGADDRKPDKDHPLQPGVPRIFGAIDFKVETAPLPATAYYPGLAPHVQQETLAAAEAEAAKAQTSLDGAKDGAGPSAASGAGR